MQLALFHEESPDAVWPVTLRFGSLLLACVLLALHWGRSLSEEVADLCELFGICGLAFYFALELVADQRARAASKKQRTIGLGDSRLEFRLQAEHKMARIVEHERHHRS